MLPGPSLGLQMQFERLKRRDFITLLGSAAAWPPAARAQSPRTRPLITVLNGASRTTGLPNRNAFLKGLHDLGYRDGQNIDIVQRYSDGDLERQRALAKELVALAPDVMFTANEAGAIETKKLTSTIPIVCPNMTDPVAFGLAETHNRPGGNVTGIVVTQPGLASKQLELLMELVPRAAAVAVLMDPSYPDHPPKFREIEAAAGIRWPIKLVQADVHSADNLDSIFDAVRRDRVDGLIVFSGAPILTTQRTRVVEFAAAARLPTIYSNREDVQLGGLMSYAVIVSQSYRRAAYFVDKILKGARAADLPIEFPTKLELAINLNTAKALGIDVPATLLAFADETIE